MEIQIISCPRCGVMIDDENLRLIESDVLAERLRNLKQPASYDAEKNDCLEAGEYTSYYGSSNYYFCPCCKKPFDKYME